MRAGTFDEVIPKPRNVTATRGEFLLRPETTVVLEAGADATDAVAVLQQTVGSSLGIELPVQPDDVPLDPVVPTITFTSVDVDPAFGREGYELVITEDDVLVRSRSRAGFGWAVQTIRQLLPVDTLGTDAEPGTAALPAGTLQDMPRYEWRGAMLDVTRHFFAVDDVKAFIDQLATYKLNRLHLHLSDDQGWRIEIESHPELTEKGGQTEVGGGEGGFYTKDQYREIVAHAAQRGVVVVPEIDVPGHTNAALNAIPELNCDGVAPEPYTRTQVGFSSLCIDLEFTYEWFDDVIAEIAALTPGEWIHIGGDESHSTDPDEYVRFVERAAAIIDSHGKAPIGWEEIGRAVLPRSAVVQHWSNPETATVGAEQGAQVILSPAPVLYFDMKYGPASTLGNSWAGTTDTAEVYGWSPAGALPDVNPTQILGVEAPLWTELITDLSEVQQMTLPRIPALSEVAWTAPDNQGWTDFATRVAAHAPRWDALGWSWTPDPAIAWE